MRATRYGTAPVRGAAPLHAAGLAAARPAPPAAGAALQLGQGVPGRLLLGGLLGRAVPGAQRVGAAVHDGRVLALPPAPRARAVVVGRDAVPLLHHLLQPA